MFIGSCTCTSIRANDAAPPHATIATLSKAMRGLKTKINSMQNKKKFAQKHLVNLLFFLRNLHTHRQMK